MKKAFREEYVKINDSDQYFLHYPTDSQFVIIYLHGGPGQTEVFFAHLMVPQNATCNYVFYDQRGTGKTQNKNKSKCSNLSLEVLISDLKATIKYVSNKYKTDKIILLGHSWGTVLGTEYVKKYPEDVVAYIGMGQMVNLNKGAKVVHEKLGEFISKAGNQVDLVKFNSVQGHPGDMIKEAARIFSKLQSKYGMSMNFGDVLKKVIRSPFFKLSDIPPYLSSMRRNKSLFDLLTDYDISDFLDYKIPVFYICGECDWVVPSVVLSDYFEKIRSPQKELFYIKDAGHLLNIYNTNEYNNVIDEIICKL